MAVPVCCRWSGRTDRREAVRPAPPAWSRGPARRTGPPAYQEFEYVRHGTVSIVAALDVQTGQVITEPTGRNDSVTFQRFLTMLDTAIDPAK